MTTNKKGSTNRVIAVGKLKEKNLEFKTSSKGKEIVIGNIVISYTSEQGVGESKIKVLQSKYKADGTENTAYKGIYKVFSTYKDIKNYGEAEADIVIVKGDLVDETYYSIPKSEFIERTEIKGSFISKAPVGTQLEIKARVEGVITNIVLTDKGEAEVTIVNMGYEGVAIPIKATVESGLVPVFMSKYKVGCNAEFNLQLINGVETTITKQEIGFGQAIEEVVEKRIFKTLMVGATIPTYGAIKEEDIRKAYAIRESKLEKKKEDTIAYANRSNTANTANTNPTGFGVPTGFDNQPTQPTNGFGMPNLV